MNTAPPAVTPKPFLKWAGGKSQLIEQYKPYIPSQFTVYHEPFLGGGALFFHLSNVRPALSARLSDINPELINTYCCVRDRVEDLIKLLEEHQALHASDYYYKIRAIEYNTNTERAARFIYLNRTCFNGLYRENSQGKFNVPIGRYKNPQICNPELLRSVSEILQSVTLEVQPFGRVLEKARDRNDFVFFDPPYYPISPTSSFTGYSRYSFGETEQIQLKNVFSELANRGVQLMLSNSDCPFIRDLYKDFPIHTIHAARYINSKGSKRGKLTEVLVTSY